MCSLVVFMFVSRDYYLCFAIGFALIGTCCFAFHVFGFVVASLLLGFLILEHLCFEIMLVLDWDAYVIVLLV